MLQQLLDRYRQYKEGQYWSGQSCIQLGMPWFVPAATEALIKRYSDFLKDATVLELGCGGSTIFFSELCKSVISVETDRAWAQQVRDLRLPNVQVLDKPDHPSIGEWLPKLIGRQGLENQPYFDVALVDGDPNAYSRGTAASIVVPMMKSRSIFITDNYYLTDSIVHAFTVPSSWHHEDFNDTHWHGCGTRISTRGF